MAEYIRYILLKITNKKGIGGPVLLPVKERSNQQIEPFLGKCNLQYAQHMGSVFWIMFSERSKNIPVIKVCCNDLEALL
jgi:hypothetical protein